MDFFVAYCTEAVAIFPSSMFRSFNCTSKTTAGSPNWSNLPTLTKCYSGSTHVLIYIDGLLSVAPSCAQTVCYLTFFHIRTFNCTEWLAGSQRAEIDPNLLTLTKCYSGSTRSAVDGLLWSLKLCPSRCYLPSLHIPERSIGLVNDWLVHQGLKLI
jgi:hypothetical protein